MCMNAGLCVLWHVCRDQRATWGVSPYLYCLRVSLCLRFCVPGQLACEAPGFIVSTPPLTIGVQALQAYGTSDRVDPGSWVTELRPSHFRVNTFPSESHLPAHACLFLTPSTCCREKLHFCKVLFLLFTKKHCDESMEGKLHNSVEHNIKGVGFFPGFPNPLSLTHTKRQTKYKIRTPPANVLRITPQISNDIIQIFWLIHQ